MSTILPIAVVDDDSSVREAIVALLRSHGHAAMGFASAAEFIRAYEFHKFACLLSDIDMPRMCGTELVRWLRDRDGTLPVILMTAQADDRLTEDLPDITAVLRKPFPCEDLAKILRALLAAE